MLLMNGSKFVRIGVRSSSMSIQSALFQLWFLSKFSHSIEETSRIVFIIVY